jgi:hypothetical protein
MPAFCTTIAVWDGVVCCPVRLILRFRRCRAAALTRAAVLALGLGLPLGAELTKLS